jgi:hypothetical protein
MRVRSTNNIDVAKSETIVITLRGIFILYFLPAVYLFDLKLFPSGYITFTHYNYHLYFTIKGGYLFA